MAEDHSNALQHQAQESQGKLDQVMAELGQTKQQLA